MRTWLRTGGKVCFGIPARRPERFLERIVDSRRRVSCCPLPNGRDNGPNRVRRSDGRSDFSVGSGQLEPVEVHEVDRPHYYPQLVAARGQGDARVADGLVVVKARTERHGEVYRGRQ